MESSAVNATVHRLLGLPKCRLLDKKDVYVQLECGGKSVRTKSRRNNLDTIYFEESFTLPGDGSRALTVKLVDQVNYTKLTRLKFNDTIIATAFLDFDKVIQAGGRLDREEVLMVAEHLKVSSPPRLILSLSLPDGGGDTAGLTPEALVVPSSATSGSETQRRSRGGEGSVHLSPRPPAKSPRKEERLCSPRQPRSSVPDMPVLKAPSPSPRRHRRVDSDDGPAFTERQRQSIGSRVDGSRSRRTSDLLAETRPGDGDTSDTEPPRAASPRSSTRVRINARPSRNSVASPSLSPAPPREPVMYELDLTRARRSSAARSIFAQTRYIQTPNPDSAGSTQASSVQHGDGLSPRSKLTEENPITGFVPRKRASVGY
eukprot:Gregarina_sp_Pseudo_9__957@NODE_1613_length_1452_cov_212_206653_g1496_i0_p1_GENE_NODE_1613_length_1452_cov_212_206653_g1496_i0NODE_1613_length_1452_cov_212_206653_g1496_i0_p1_ORF_typecomplete_len373_score91_67C2/PF00168_30/5_2e06_NODE_1613_length_1452_cov_212_206653_g1496_i01381256